MNRKIKKNNIPINKNIFERCLLTDTIPFETPFLFSNWGSFNYLYNLKDHNPPSLFNSIFNYYKDTIPYNYKIKKNLSEYRYLSLIHPTISRDIVNFYKNFDLLIVQACQKSMFSIRKPHAIAKYFTLKEGDHNRVKYVEQFNESKVYASSYFSYRDFTHIYKFYDSDMFSKLEHNYKYLRHIDISKCFDSIYTHSICWALRGKRQAKKLRNIKNSFPEKYDKIMERMNDGETHGIVIGPELSRIFAEIIFQEIDLRVQEVLKQKEIVWGENYCCLRYVDDYSIFYNDQNLVEPIINAITDELHKYKLYINNEKTKLMERPFITDISKCKLRLSKYANELMKRITEKERSRISSTKEINALRSIIVDSNENQHALTSFFISVITKKLKYYNNLLTKIDNNRLYKIINLFIDLVFHWIAIDTRVMTIYRLANFLLNIIELAESLDMEYKLQIRNRIFAKLLSTIQHTKNSESHLEILNILILLKETKTNNTIPDSLIKDLLSIFRKKHFSDENQVERLSYFDIIVFLYVFENNPYYNSFKSIIMNDIDIIFTNLPIEKYAESCYLFLDVLSCPYIDDVDKQNISMKVLKSNPDVRSDSLSISNYVNYGKKQIWFFDWKAKDRLKHYLRKKEFLSTY